MDLMRGGALWPLQATSTRNTILANLSSERRYGERLEIELKRQIEGRKNIFLEMVLAAVRNTNRQLRLEDDENS
jgi:hypothetical protein